MAAVCNLTDYTQNFNRGKHVCIERMGWQAGWMGEFAKTGTHEGKSVSGVVKTQHAYHSTHLSPSTCGEARHAGLCNTSAFLIWVEAFSWQVQALDVPSETDHHKNKTSAKTSTGRMGFSLFGLHTSASYLPREFVAQQTAGDVARRPDKAASYLQKRAKLLPGQEQKKIC